MIQFDYGLSVKPLVLKKKNMMSDRGSFNGCKRRFESSGRDYIPFIIYNNPMKCLNIPIARQYSIGKR